MFSSPVPAQLVPSIWQDLHDGIAYVDVRISLMTSAFIATTCRFDDTLPAFICNVASENSFHCRTLKAAVIAIGGGWVGGSLSRLKE
jgi:hypothetical protein